MKGQRRSRQIAELVFNAVRQLEKPQPILPMSSPCEPGFMMRKQAGDPR
jgi:hypothetical protein